MAYGDPNPVQPRQDGPAPVFYKLPPGQTLQTESATAVFDGSAASVPFKPAIAFYAGNGRLIARVPTTETVAAGDSAEVTFFPFGLPGSESAPATAGSLPLVVLSGFTQSIPSGVLTDLEFTFSDNRPENLGTAFSVTGGGPFIVNILEEGVYFASILAGNAPSGYAAHIEMDYDLEADAISGTWSPDAAWYPEIAASAPWMRWTGFFTINHNWIAPPFEAHWSVFQASGSDQVFDARLTIAQVSRVPVLYDPII